MASFGVSPRIFLETKTLLDWFVRWTVKTTSSGRLLKISSDGDKKNLAAGFAFKGKTLFIKITSVMCDAPARAYIKAIKSHTGYSGCDKCTSYGVHLDQGFSKFTFKGPNLNYHQRQKI